MTTEPEMVVAALLEAGRPDLCHVVGGFCGGNGAGRHFVVFEWDRLERPPTLDEVRIVARAHDLMRQATGATSPVADPETWHHQITYREAAGTP